MPKAPSFQFYPGDWRRDTQVQMASMETRGVWFEMLCCMWDAPERGKLCARMDMLSKLLGCDICVTCRAIKELILLNIADVQGYALEPENCNGNVHSVTCHIDVTVINRRMSREQRRRNDWKKRKQKERSRKGVTQKSRSHSSSSLYSTPYSPPKKSRRKSTDVLSKIQAPRFARFWETYPKKKSKGQAEKAWMKIKPSEQLLETMISKIEQAKTSVEWTKEDGQFIPYPATWLNAKGWEDEYAPQKGPYDDIPKV